MYAYIKRETIRCNSVASSHRQERLIKRYIILSLFTLLRFYFILFTVYYLFPSLVASTARLWGTMD